MRFPCPGCGTLTNLEIPESGTIAEIKGCIKCGGRFRIEIERPGVKSDPEAYRLAKHFAREKGIDIATAYSVLEGLITLDEPSVAGEAQPAKPAPDTGRTESTRFRRWKPPPPISRAASRSKGGARATDMDALPYDPDFEAAVRDKCLTIQQAIERGNRETLASRLASRYRLPAHLALLAADNRITIRQALQQKTAWEARLPKPPVSGMPLVAVGAAAVVLSVIVWMGARSIWEGPPERPMTASWRGGAGTGPADREAGGPTVPTPPPPLTVPKTDAAGQLVEVVGPDPRSVLVSFCGSGRSAGMREPVEISETIPPNATLRRGVFRSLAQPQAPMRSIRIRRDPLTGRWVAGDGRQPIATEEYTDPVQGAFNPRTPSSS